MRACFHEFWQNGRGDLAHVSRKFSHNSQCSRNFRRSIRGFAGNFIFFQFGMVRICYFLRDDTRDYRTRTRFVSHRDRGSFSHGCVGANFSYTSK